MSRLPEQKSWDTFSGGSNGWALKCMRVENMCVDGMSDVIGINKAGVVFWIENKALAAWPGRHTTFPLADAFEPGQIPFMRQWKWWRGHAFVLLRVGIDYYLLDPDMDLKTMTALQLIQGALLAGKQAIYHHLESLEPR